MKVEPFLLASTLEIIIGQRLVRRLTDTKEAYKLSSDQLAQLMKVVDMARVLEALKKENIVRPEDTWKTIHFYKAISTANNKENSAILDIGSSDTGFSGRIGIHEVLKMTSSIRELVMKDATSGIIEAQAKKEGMLTMLEDGIFKCVQGLTTLEEVFRVVSE